MEIEKIVKNVLHDIIINFEKKTNMVSLGSIAHIEMGQSPPGHSYNDIEEGIPMLNGPTEFGKVNPTPIKWTTEPTKICKKGEILICVRGATTGRMNWADKEYCIGRGLAAITANKDICESRYLHYIIDYKTQVILNSARGSTFPNIPKDKLGNIELPLAKLSEQKDITRYLDSIQENVDKLKKLVSEISEKISELRPSILNKAFKGEL